MLKAALFDWDGTLADSRKVIVASFLNALTTINCDINNEFIERLIGVGSAETFRKILRASETSFDESLISALVEEKIHNEIDMSANIKLFPGALELLGALHGKVRIGLASMNDRVTIYHLLRTTGTQRFFEVIVTAGEITKSKPNPEIFLKCAIALGIEPHQCVVFEDSIFGVEAAKTAEMACIAVLTGVYSKEELEKAEPDLIIDSLKRKTDIFNLIFR